jgi:hypothetical protein
LRAAIYHASVAAASPSGERTVSYAADLYQWTQEQAAALRRRAANEIDFENLAEEIEDMGKSTRRELGSRLEVLLVHLLKWYYQPELQCGSWRGSIMEQRHQIDKLLADSPSLQNWPEGYLAEAYAYARRKALDETGLLRLPEACPWSIAQIFDRDFLP